MILAPVDAQTGERRTYRLNAVTRERIPDPAQSRQEQGSADTGRDEAQVQTGSVAITAPNYEATVTAEEAPLLARLMADRKIETAQFVHGNGSVTYSFSAADRDEVEQLIAKLRAVLSNAVR